MGLLQRFERILRHKHSLIALDDDIVRGASDDLVDGAPQREGSRHAVHVRFMREDSRGQRRECWLTAADRLCGHKMDESELPESGALRIVGETRRQDRAAQVHEIIR